MRESSSSRWPSPELRGAGRNRTDESSILLLWSPRRRCWTTSRGFLRRSTTWPRPPRDDCHVELQHGILWSCNAGLSPSSSWPYSLVPAPASLGPTSCYITGPGRPTNTAPTLSRPEDAAATPKGAPSAAPPLGPAPRSFKPWFFAPNPVTHPHLPSHRPSGSSLPILTPFRIPELLQRPSFSRHTTTTGTPVHAR